MFVIGMHRSGTSAVTRVVNLLGVSLGPRDALKPPSPHNPAGFWEVGALKAFNEELLAELGGAWDAPPLLEGSWSQSGPARSLREPAIATLRRFHDGGQWVWKDPRNSILLPFWLAAVDVRPVVVLVNRHPLETAASLASRDGFSVRLGVALWERYMRQALRSISGLPVVVAHYAEVLRAPEAWAASARDFLTAQGMDCSDAAGEEETTRFLDPDLRHTEFTARDFAGDPSVSDAQRELFAALESLTPTHERFDPPPLPDETPWTEPLLAERRFVKNALRDQNRRRTAAGRARRKTLRRAQKHLERLERDLSSPDLNADVPVKGMRRDVHRANALLEELLAAEQGDD